MIVAFKIIVAFVFGIIIGGAGAYIYLSVTGKLKGGK